MAFALFGILALSSCAPRHVELSADKCWSVSDGDKVDGSARLYVPSPFTFHVGPEIAGGRSCLRYGLTFADKDVDAAYRQIVDVEMPDDLAGEPREGTIVLSGEVRSEVGGRNLVIETSRIRYAGSRRADMR